MQMISKQNLRGWLTRIAQDHRLIAPTQVSRVILFRPVADVEQVVLDYVNSVLSPKEWFFPRTDTLFTIERNADGVELTPPTLDQKQVIFGIRPCDARAITKQDKVFLGDPPDSNYGQRRTNTTLIGLACAQAAPWCFCTSVGIQPDDAGDVDVMLKQVGDNYLVESITEKGVELVKLATTTEGEGTFVPARIQVAVPTENLPELMRSAFKEEFWDQAAERCFSCKICVYLCPTCHCFDVRDAYVDGQLQRLRTWDSCQSPQYNRLAGGYNPRGTKGARLRQFYYHKFLYYPEKWGEYLCVGCGRCVSNCPVNIDIREMLTTVKKHAATKDPVAETV